MSAKVEYRRLGSSGLKISVPIMGTACFGSDKWAGYVLNEKDALPILKRAWDAGINTFDTSNDYSNGESEKILGKFMEKYNIPRSQIIILTKCYGLVADTPGLLTILMPDLQKEQKYVNKSGLSRAAIFNAVEESLKRLKTSYIDVYQIHHFDSHTPAEETMKALHDLVQSGKVRYLGACTMPTWQFAYLNQVADKHGWTKFVSIQPEYSLLYREEERELLPYCKHNGIGIIPYFALASGVLARPPNTAVTKREECFKGTPWEVKQDEADKQIISRVEEIAHKRGKSMAEVSLAWSKAKITSPLVGITRIEAVNDMVNVNGLELTPEEIHYLEEPYKPKPVRG